MSLQWFPGASIGLLVGLLVGLSASEVVGSVIAGLIALLAAFFGLGGGSQTAQSGTEPGISPKDQAARIAGFGLVCAVAVLLGLYVRTHNLWGASPAELAKAWETIGFSPEDSRNIAVYQQVGLLPEGFTVDDKRKLAGTRAGVLFNERSYSECDSLSNKRKRQTKQRLDAFKIEGEGWAAVATAIDDLPEDKQSRLMEAVWQIVCNQKQKK